MASTTPSNMLTDQYIQRAIEHPQEKLYCKDLHPGITCEMKFLSQFASGCKSLAKMYLIVHLVPFLLFKRKKLKQNPKRQLLKLLSNFCKSMLFAGGYSAIVRYFICWWTHVKNYQGDSGMPAAILAGSTLFFQPYGRQSQIALFCLNKSTEVTYHCLRRRNYPVRIPHGECLLLAMSIAVIAYHYLNNKNSIRDNYKSALDKILGNC